MHMSGDLSPDQFWDFASSMEDRVRATADVFPLFAVAGWTDMRMLGDWESLNGRLIRAGLLHGLPDSGPRVHVQSTSDDPTAVVERLRYPGPGYRKLGEPSGHVELSVAGELSRFDLWADGARWWATVRHAQCGIVVEAAELAPESVVLERITDVEPYLNGRRSFLKAVRGES
jgi:hypothetical protein